MVMITMGASFMGGAIGFFAEVAISSADAAAMASEAKIEGKEGDLRDSLPLPTCIVKSKFIGLTFIRLTYPNSR